MNESIKIFETKLSSNELDIINKNLIAVFKMLKKINKHLARIDYDGNKIKETIKNKGE